MKVPGDPAGWTTKPNVAMLDASHLAPGQTAVGGIELRNTGGQPGLLGIQFAHVTGSLSAELRYSVGPAGDPLADHPESLSSLESGVVMPLPLDAGSSVDYAISVTLPNSAGNEWESRRTSFDVIWYLSATALGASSGSPGGSGGAGSTSSSSSGASSGASSVEVTGMGRGSTAGGVGSMLAFTGAPIARAIEVAVGLSLGGCLLLVGAHRRRQKTRA